VSTKIEIDSETTVAIPGSSLGLVAAPDGNFVILDLDQMPKSPQLVLSREALTEWAAWVVKKNTRRGCPPYDLDAMEKNVIARHVNGGGMTCAYWRSMEEWCISPNENNPRWVHFTLREMNSLVAFMGTDEFRMFVTPPDGNVRS
jgi:hypothetical protein